jgi:hypothetical protein
VNRYPEPRSLQHVNARGKSVTTIFDAADQRVTEKDSLVLLEIDVDAAEPADTDWHVRLLAPVKADAGQAFAHRVNWRGGTADRR